MRTKWWCFMTTLPYHILNKKIPQPFKDCNENVFHDVYKHEEPLGSNSFKLNQYNGEVPKFYIFVPVTCKGILTWYQGAPVKEDNIQ